MTITKRCCFEYETKCAVLSEKHCNGCKFKKNYKEFVKAQEAAEKSLKDRGLRAVKVDTDKGAIITAVKG